MKMKSSQLLQNTKLKLGNHCQFGILHYTESNFLDNIEIESILNV